ncbi:MAG: heme oxygenase [Oscillatoriales cyanobacterium SM2_2_1]|nr:heme oxygenase [Oscillatoriales cyanobacterium SM2_2_1]
MVRQLDTQESVPAQSLATRLREGTQKSHSAAEGTDFIRCFLRGVVDKASYRLLVANLYFVYSALEEEITRHRHHPVLGQLFFEELWRQKSLELDLLYYFGSDWRHCVQPSLACQKYLQRIRDLSAESPELLVAHAYTRYMGDLSGGQILKKIAREAMALTDGGTSFYEFEAIRNQGEFKKQYRQAIDGLPVNEDLAIKIVDEANFAFHLNMEMFRELQGNWFLGLSKVALNSVISALRSPRKVRY